MSPTPALTFLPDDPPRRGLFALQDLAETPAGGRVQEVELVVLDRGRFRRRQVRVRVLTLAEAVPWLVELPPEDGEGSAIAVWSAAVKAGLGLIARGRLHPGVTESGLDTWRAGPLDEADEGWLRALVAAMPMAAHLVPLPGRGPLRLRSPERLVRECWDALADSLPRTAAAPLARRHPAFAETEPVAVENLRAWLDAGTAGAGDGARPGLRLDPLVRPDHEDGFEAVLQLRSQVDPSLVIDAERLWDAPAPVLSRLGESAETDLLLALRRGANAWPPLARLLDGPRPERLALEDSEVSDLLGPIAGELEAVGLEVLWPSELVLGQLVARVVVTATPSPPGVAEPRFTLDQMLEFRWELTLGGEMVTAEELAILAEAKRPLVRLRGRWVRADPALLRRVLERGPERIPAGEALGAALAGTMRIGDEEVAARGQGSLADLAERLRGLGDAGLLPQPSPPGLKGELRHYQERGLAWLQAMSELGLGGCLADDMGLGKTLQVIALQLLRHRGPMLVVCPASLLGNWERELRHFAPSLAVHRYHGSGRALPELEPDAVVLTSYGVVVRDVDRLAEVPWDLAVADEAQMAKNPLSKTARTLRQLPSRVRLALTGTPVENRLSELWSILDWAVPGLLGTLETFRRRVAVPIERYHDPAATAHFSTLVRPFLLRRRKTDPGIAPELPPKTEMNVIVPLTPEQLTLYEATVREALAEIATTSGINRRGLVFKLLTALKQICNHPAQFLKEAAPLAGRSGKLEALQDLLEVILAEGESTLIFTQYVQMARLIERHLAERGVGTLFLHGGLQARKRDQMVQDFQAGAAPVFLLSLKAGGVGLNLTRATQVVHFDRWWNPAVEDQATDRAYRIGQDRPVQVRRLVTEGTIEDRIASLMIAKRELAESVVGSGEAWIGNLTDAELTDLVRLRRTA